MNAAVQTYYEKMLDKLVPELKRRNINAVYCKNRDEARQAVLDMIPPGSSVNTGNSVTLRECGIVDTLKTGNYQYYANMIQNEPDEAQRRRLRRQATAADYCLGSLNAIALTGEIVNIDGGGSRIGGYAYGAGSVILVAGVNKIVPTLDLALKRVRHYVAPANALGGGHTPLCVQDGVCHEGECYPPERICGKLLIIEKESTPGRITVVFVGEELGL